MKALLTKLCIAGTILVSLQSCSKKDEATPQTATSSAGFTCKIGGTAFTADSSRLNIYSGGFTIIAFKGGTTAFEINLKEPAVKSHSLDGTAGESATYVKNANYYASNSGSLVVTAFDAAAKTASGTFSFTAVYNNTTETITDGQFTIN